MIEFGIKDFLDILLVASLLFYVYRLMKESRSLNIFVGIMLFVLIWLFVSRYWKCACWVLFWINW